MSSELRAATAAKLSIYNLSSQTDCIKHFKVILLSTCHLLQS